MAFCAYREDKRKEVKNELCKESLFRFMYRKLHDKVFNGNHPKLYDYSIVEIWEDAKLYVKGISEAEYPDVEMTDKWDSTKLMYEYFDYSQRGDVSQETQIEQFKLINSEYYSLHFCFAECVYSILSVCYVNSDEHTEGVIETCMDIIEETYRKIDIDFYNEIKNLLGEKKIKNDYAYWSSADLPLEEKRSEKELVTYDGTNDELREEVKKLKEALACYEQGPIVEKTHNKVRLEVFCKLLESANVDFDQRGNKAEAARLAETILKLPISTCSNYMTGRDLNTSEHNDEVVSINTQLKKLRINFSL